MCQLILMVKQQNSSAPPTKICFLRLCCNFRGFMLHCQHDSFPDPSCNFHSFVHDFSQGPSSNSHSSVLSSRLLQVVLVNFCCFVVHCQHDSFPYPSCNFSRFRAQRFSGSFKQLSRLRAALSSRLFSKSFL